MAITSEEIHNQSFTVDRKGYDVDEVDVFLEHVAAEIDNLNAEIDELNARLAQYEGQGGYLDDGPMDMDAAFAEPALPEELAAQADAEEEPAASATDDEKDARIAELERQLEEQKSDASAIASALVTAQRSAQEVIDAANAEAKRIHDNAEADAEDIVDRANAERIKIEDAIEELERSHKQTCESYSEALKAFIEDANKKLDDIEDELAKRDGKKRAHARFASPVQAPVHKPAPAGATGAVAPSYTAPAMPATGAAAPVTPAATIPAQVKPSAVEKDLSGFGDASDAFDLGDID
ncbi:DivIVA domain-containing protein [uncultured Slackia sp.]|uniref:DivIVA domain-containing protein n=1 Tax=uncultured Slackia sp. TaxID=665903 RepID=UPI0025FACE2B|nr:DivIVA domain-containing protein [uncultured Slackia sp.]